MTAAAVSEREQLTQVVPETAMEDDVASDAAGPASEGDVVFDGGDENDGALAAAHRGSISSPNARSEQMTGKTRKMSELTPEQRAFAAIFKQASTPAKKTKYNSHPIIKTHPIQSFFPKG